jgi:MerR family transcriptional regulator/heat shock protein HspR
MVGHQRLMQGSRRAAPGPLFMPDPSERTQLTPFDDADFPAYTMGRATAVIGVTPAFLRSLGTIGLIEPQRSLGGHRRYSRHQLQLATRVRQLLDEGLPLVAAGRIVLLEDQLAAAHRRIAELGGEVPSRGSDLAGAARNSA